MNPQHHHHPGVIGHIPIGMVTAHGMGGPVGIGQFCHCSKCQEIKRIGVPLMTTAPIMGQTIQQSQQQQQQQPSSSQPPQNIVSPDSSDDGKDATGNPLNHCTPSPNSSPHSTNGTSVAGSSMTGNAIPWPNQILQPIAGLGYPVMGVTMGPPPNVLSEPGMLYGIISAAPSDLNISQNPVQNPIVSLPPNATSIPQVRTAVPVVTPRVSMNGGNSAQQQQQTKEIIHCKSCTLFPPNPSAPPPTTRDKPPGCRTVFVGGLPENVTDDIIREIFDRCGEVTTIRMSKKNFCHIRFELESFVENAIYLSGYRVRIGSNSDAANIGRLHVDYAQARDDLYEWECRERKLLRERRHRERIEAERLLPPSPPPVVHYSDHEAVNVAEKIKVDETFIKAVQVLITWIDRGDCSKRNANNFYSMIQSTNSHVRRLLGEKSQYDEELNKAKELMHQRMQGLFMQFSQIEKVFAAASHKKAWDHFTKAQRKNIDIWKKQAAEIKNMQLEEALNERADEEMDLSDTDSDEENHCSSPMAKKMRIRDDNDKTVNKLKEENDSLRCQLEAFKNEIDLIKADLKTDLEAKDQQLRELQQQLEESCRSQPNNNMDSTSHSNGNTSPFPSSNGNSAVASSMTITMHGDAEKTKCCLEEIVDNCDSSSSSITCHNTRQVGSHTCDAWINSGEDIKITEMEIRLISIISTFLHCHPFGASIDYLVSYAQKAVLPSVRPSYLEALMNKFPSLFRQEISGVGATLERKWIFVGFS